MASDGPRPVLRLLRTQDRQRQYLLEILHGEFRRYESALHRKASYVLADLGLGIKLCCWGVLAAIYGRSEWQCAEDDVLGAFLHGGICNGLGGVVLDGEAIHTELRLLSWRTQCVHRERSLGQTRHHEPLQSPVTQKRYPGRVEVSSGGAYRVLLRKCRIEVRNVVGLCPSILILAGCRRMARNRNHRGFARFGYGTKVLLLGHFRFGHEDEHNCGICQDKMY